MAIYKLQGIAILLRRYRPTSLPSIRTTLDETRSSSSSSSFIDRSRLQGRMLSNASVSIANEGNLPSQSPSVKPRFPVLMRWFVGSILSLLLSLWMPKWSTILRIGGEVEGVMKEVEQVAEVVEKVATMAEKVAEEVADQLPDQSKLKEIATLAEKVSNEVAKDAHVADLIIHKVDSVKDGLEDLETLAEPLINKIIHDQKHS